MMMSAEATAQSQVEELPDLRAGRSKVGERAKRSAEPPEQGSGSRRRADAVQRRGRLPHLPTQEAVQDIMSAFMEAESQTYRQGRGPSSSGFGMWSQGDV